MALYPSPTLLPFPELLPGSTVPVRIPGSAGTLGYFDVEDATGHRVPFHGTTARKVTNVQGLPGLGLSGARAQRRPRPNGHGSINQSRLLKEKLLTVEGFVAGADQVAVQNELDDLTGVLYDALEVDRVCRWRRGDTGLELMAMVRLADDDVQTTVQPGGQVIKYQAHLVLSDPRGYTQQPRESVSAPMSADGGGSTFPMTFPATFELGNAGICAYTNDGTVPTPMVARIYGRLVDPIVELDTGHRIVLAGTVAAGDYLELRSGPSPAVLLNGTVNRMPMRDFSQTRWFDLPRGNGTVRLIASDADPDAYMKLIYSPAYG